ncbi:condensin complex protein MksE [Gillisia sp. Q332]|uniref:condensin complex protein MksE n=1 Tax=Gillisia xinjiangensis TaxID=3384765 RepID=UPI00391C158C
MQEFPKHTAEIFEVLSKGKFICSNSSNDLNRKLYGVLEDENHYEQLTSYFENINFILEKGDGYFYFSRDESKVNLERKLEFAFKWIDILDFFKTFDPSFGSGFRFSIADIMVRLNTDADLKTKLTGLKKVTKKSNFTDAASNLAKFLIRDNFVELQDEVSGTYKVLSSFAYLEELILAIHIPEDIANEIPE